MEELAKKYQQYGWFLRVNWDWIDSLYTHNRHNYGGALMALDKMYKSPITAMHSNGGPNSNNGLDYYLRDLVYRHVVGEDYNKDTTRLEVFPGPMAMQLCRRHLPFLRDNEYWITEKSDGIRAMLLNHHLPDFPRWSKWPKQSKKTYASLPLFDNLRLEYHFQQARMHQQAVVPLRIEHKEYIFYVNEMRLEDKQTKQQFDVSRDLGWSFSYLFDRKFEFFLCTEQFVFVTPKYKNIAHAAIKQRQAPPHIEHQPIVILDGEIIFNLRDKRNNYTVYDVISCTNYSNETIHLCGQTMAERKDAIISFVSETHHFFNKALLPQGASPKSLQILPKHFYAKSAFEQVRACITESPSEPNKYLYKNYNLNDGLIFTPDSPALYTFAPGSNNYLLKWKWPNKLTSDFLVVPASSSEPSDYFYFYYWSRNSAIFYRTMKVAPTTSQSILNELRKSQPGTGRIVECAFEVPEGNDYMFDPDSDIQDPEYLASEPAMWRLDLIRDDKNHANGFKVIANTLENMIEDVTENDLRHYIGIKLTNDGNASRATKLRDDERIQHLFEQGLYQCQCFAHFRVQRHHINNEQLFLSYSILVYRDNSPDPKTHWIYYYEFEECLFADEETEATLRQMVSPDQFPDIFVQCIFVPHLGKWKIISVHGDESKCSGTYLLRVLEYKVCLNARVLHQDAAVTSSTMTSGFVADQSYSYSDGVDYSHGKRKRSSLSPDRDTGSDYNPYSVDNGSSNDWAERESTNYAKKLRQ